MIKAAIFDFNGVVVTNNDLATYRAAAKARGVWFPLFLLRYAWYHFPHQTGQLAPFTFWSKVLASSKPALTREEYEKLIVQPYRANTFFPETLAIVAALREKGIRCVLLTNTSDYQVAVNKALNRYKGFDGCVLSNEIGTLKPLPSAFRMGSEAAHAKPSETLFVDDSWYNLWMAWLLGYKAIPFHSPGQLKNAIKRLCAPILG